MSQRYFCDTDDAMHWYIIPIERKDEWDAWVAQICSDKPEEEINWDEPDYAIRLNGGAHLLSFELPLYLYNGKSPLEE